MHRKLPKKLIVIENKDKSNHETWKVKEGKPPRDELAFPCPTRFIAVGKPGCGKTTAVINIAIRADPPFERIIVCHYDSEYTQEFEELEGVEMWATIPEKDDIDGKEKTLIILEDLDFKSLGKEQAAALKRLYGYLSTHKFSSCILCAQDWSDVPKLVRRCTNVWIIWKMDDTQSLQLCMKKAGIAKDKYLKLMKLLVGPHSSLWIDRTSGTPYPLRVNGYDLIEEKIVKKERKTYQPKCTLYD